MFALLFLLALSAPRGMQALQPKCYSSPSAEWTLSVDPSSVRGAGPSHVAVTRGNQPVWEAELPFTFWEARIADTGHCAGFGYTNGHPGEFGHIVVALLGPEGALLLDERVEVARIRGPHGPPSPEPLGTFAHPQLDRFVVRAMFDRGGASEEQWWMYRMSTGEKLECVRPKERIPNTEALRWTVDARPIAGTPLTLVQWRHWDRQSHSNREDGVRFVLLDADLEPVWTLPRHMDLRHPDPQIEDVQLTKLRWASLILDDGPGRFELRHLRSDQQVECDERVEYIVSGGADSTSGWTVRTVARAPYVEPVAEPPAPWPTLTLERLRPTELHIGGVSLTSPLRDIDDFDFDAAGNVRFVRREADDAATLVSLDEMGAVVREVRVAPLGARIDGERRWSALRRDRWLFTLSPFEAAAFSRAWFVDGASGVATEIEGFRGPFVDAVAAAPDGGFAVLGTRARESDSTPTVLAFDAAGRQRWEQRGAQDPQDEAALFFPIDIAVDADGAVLVLDALRRSVQQFGADGALARRVQIETASGDESSYFTDLLVEPSGNWLVHDFHDERTWRRVNRNGKVLASFVPERDDSGDDPGSSSRVRVDASGRIWGADRGSFFVMGTTGVARTVFGAEPDGTRLDETFRVHFDGRGRVAIGDRRAHAFHLFALNGVRVGYLPPDPIYSDRRYGAHTLLAAPDGPVYVQPNMFRDQYVAFSAAGVRLGTTKLGGDHAAFLDSGERWVATTIAVKGPFLRKLSADGEVLVEIRRRLDRNFLDDIRGMALAPDGGVAVLTQDERDELHFYSPTGDALRTIDLGSHPGWSWNRVQYAERWIAVWGSSDDVLLISLPEGHVSIATFPGVDPNSPRDFEFSDDGAELLCVTTKPPMLHRFALPR
jgi:hypothetical protein